LALPTAPQIAPLSDA